MKLKDNGIFDLTTWKAIAPPLGNDKQWKDGRSAKELARYMMANYPNMPKEIEEIVSNFDSNSSEFEWDAEYVTDFEKYGLGRGNGRNHDAFLFNDNIVIGIESKADEPFGSQTIGEALTTSSTNKLHRINTMIDMLFGDDPGNYKNLRYQLVTATTALLLEARERQVTNAMLIVITFKKQDCFDENKMQRNKSDLLNFISECRGEKSGNCYIISTQFGEKNDIKLFVSNIEITVI